MNRRSRSVAILTFGLLIFFIVIAYLVIDRPQSASPPLVSSSIPKASQTPIEVYYGLPMKLRIPSISVDAEIEYVGLTKQNDMESPSTADSTGWYKYGTIPGDNGSAVIAGHVVGPKGEPGVFYNLKKLKVGDDLSVVDGKGQTISFKVREIRAYDHNEQHDEVFNPQDSSHLNIITCAGGYDTKLQKYLERLVVFADKV